MPFSPEHYAVQLSLIEEALLKNPENQQLVLLQQELQQVLQLHQQVEAFKVPQHTTDLPSVSPDRSEPSGSEEENDKCENGSEQYSPVSFVSHGVVDFSQPEQLNPDNTNSKTAICGSIHSNNNNSNNYAEIALWEQHTTGVGSKLLAKLGWRVVYNQ